MNEETEGLSIQEAQELRKSPTPQKDVAAHTPNGRPKRRPLSFIKKLGIPPGIEKEEGYVYRYIINSGDRVMMYQGAWWEQVVDGNNKPVRVHSGNRRDPNEYLLLYRTRAEYYQEDLEENRKKPIDLAVEHAKLKKDDGISSEYVPEGHEAVISFKN